MDRITLYFIPSPVGLSWKSPHAINRSSLVNGLAELVLSIRHCIGHVNVELDFPSLGRRLLTGMTAADFWESSRLLRHEGYGMGVLFHAFRGRLEASAEIEEQLPGRYRSGKLSFLEVLVSRDAAERLLAYHEGFEKRRSKLLYGFPVSPLRGEGGGCSEFAASFLELVGLMDPDFRQNWTRSIRIPSRLVGGPKTGRKVSLWEVLLRREGARWSAPDEAHFPLEFWDPEAMHFWVRRVWAEQSRLAEGERRFQPAKRGEALGLLLDQREIPVPKMRIWIDDSECLSSDPVSE